MNRLILLPSILATLLLIGCSNGAIKREPIKVITIDRQIVHPTRPERPKLKDEVWVKCQNEPKNILCMTEQAASNLVDNKVKVGRYMDKQDAIIDYYRGLDKKTPSRALKKKKISKTVY